MCPTLTFGPSIEQPRGPDSAAKHLGVAFKNVGMRLKPSFSGVENTGNLKLKLTIRRASAMKYEPVSLEYQMNRSGPRGSRPVVAMG